jgi:hypothetical protein
MIDRNGTAPRPLAVGEEPPPLDADNRPAAPRRPGKASKPKGKRDTAGRFQTINAFIDVTMAGLTLAERSVWLILWRDTKPTGNVVKRGSLRRGASIYRVRCLVRER